MKKLLLLLLTLAVGHGLAQAPPTYYGQIAWDIGTSLPGNCSAPAFFYKTDTTTLYACSGGTFHAAGGASGTSLPSVNGLVACTGTLCSTTTARSIVGGSGITVTNGDAVAGNPTISPDLTVLLSRLNFTSNPDTTLQPVSSSGTAYTACPTQNLAANGWIANGVTLTQYSPLSRFTFIPDVSSGASPTINICALGTLAMQWNVNGTLTAITTNNLTAGVPYVMILGTGNPPTVAILEPSNSAGGVSTTGSPLNTYMAFFTAAGTISGDANATYTHTAANKNQWLFQAGSSQTNADPIILFQSSAAAKIGGVISEPSNSTDIAVVFGDPTSSTAPLFGNDGFGGIYMGQRGVNALSGSTYLHILGSGLRLAGGGLGSIEYQLSAAGQNTIYNSIATVGEGVPPVYGAIHQTAKVAAITTATLCAAAICNAGNNQYHIHYAFIEAGTACGTPGAGGVTFLLTWTDFNGTTHSAVSLGMDDASSINAVSQTFHFQTSLGAAWGSGDFNINTNGSIIQYATGYTACGVGTGTYNLDIAVTQLQ
jgi:hypothetical protein